LQDQGGTGLGLHIVYSFVTNRLGAGSTSIPSPARHAVRSSFRACATGAGAE